MAEPPLMEHSVEGPDDVVALREFFVSLENIIQSYRGIARKNRDEDAWFEELFPALSRAEEKFIEEIRKIDDGQTIGLLTLELRAVTSRMNQIVQSPSISAIFLPFRRKVELKDGVKAGGVVLDSIKDLLGDAAPYWIKALLTIGKEGVDVLTG